MRQLKSSNEKEKDYNHFTETATDPHVIMNNQLLFYKSKLDKFLL